MLLSRLAGLNETWKAEPVLQKERYYSLFTVEDYFGIRLSDG